MNIQRKLKSILVNYLESQKPDPGIEVVDAKNLDIATLPVIAVEITNESAHSQALYNVIICQVSILYRVHAGDIAQDDLDDQLELIEAALEDPNTMIELSNPFLIFKNWIYQGSSQDWSDSMIDTVFTAECIVARP
jgi:hypothetical protein